MRSGCQTSFLRTALPDEGREHLADARRRRTRPTMASACAAGRRRRSSSRQRRREQRTEDAAAEEADERQHADDEALPVAARCEQQARAEQDQVEQVAMIAQQETTTLPVMPGWNVHTNAKVPALLKIDLQRLGRHAVDRSRSCRAPRR